MTTHHHKPEAISGWLSQITGLIFVLTGAAVIIAAGLPDRATAGALYFRSDGAAVAPEVGAIAPPLNLETADGGEIALDGLRGQVVVLNYWATWCGPCLTEMPALQTIADRYPAQVTVLGVNAGESPERVRAWSQSLGLRFPLLLDPRGTAAAIYRLRGQPTTVIVAPDGRIREILYGPADVSALERAVIALLPGPTERELP